MKKIIATVAVALALLAGVVVWAGRHAGNMTASQQANAAIDNLSAVGVRLLELPAILLLACAAVLGTALAVILSRFATATRRVTWMRVSLSAAAFLVLFGAALAADRKIRSLQNQVDELRTRLQDQRLAMGTTPFPEKGNDPPATTRASTRGSETGPANAATTPVKTGAAARRTTPMFDVDKVSRALVLSFGSLNFRPVVYDQASDMAKVTVTSPPIVAYAAVIDLRTPGLELKLGGSLAAKTLTSDFAFNNQCTIAINGEAGASPRMNSGLGVWTGHFISKGQVLLKEQPGNKRPFLSFDKQNHATFTPMAAGSRVVAADAYNVMWGRVDAIINGVIQTENERDRQPRTAMGIDKDGSHLYLMVVDGRQQRYSVGLTRGEVGAFLQAFGAYNGMLCDEGGSSCIYMKNYGGIVNSPSDGDERETYTHFGISLH